MKRIVFIFPILILLLCSWVNPYTIDTYNGDISFADSDYNVTNLSGRITYFFDEYVNLGLLDDGTLYNASSVSISGKALINGQTYNIQMPSLGGFQIQQSYILNNFERTTWVDYDLYPDIAPSNFDLSDLAPIFILFLVFILIPLIFYRGILS